MRGQFALLVRYNVFCNRENKNPQSKLQQQRDGKTLKWGGAGIFSMLDGMGWDGCGLYF
jgi:hypothetical protein